MAWRNRALVKKRQAQRIAELMDKNARQIGFNAIRLVDWERRSTQHKLEVLSRYFKNFKRYNQLKAVDIWKVHVFTVVKRKQVAQNGSFKIDKHNG